MLFPFLSEQNSASLQEKKIEKEQRVLSILISYDMSLPRIVPKVPAIKQWPKLFKATASSKSAIRLNLISVPTAGKISHSNRFHFMCRLQAFILLVDRAMAELNFKSPKNMTAVELYPGIFCDFSINTPLPLHTFIKTLTDFIYSWSVGVGVWTSALINGGLKKVIALEPHNKFFPYISVSRAH